MNDAPTVSLVGGVVFAEGEVHAASSQAFCAALLSAALSVPPPAALVVELGDLELEDGVSVARVVTALRGALLGRTSLELREAPQMLAHTLYKVGMLGGALRLVAPRSDEGSGAG